MSKIQIDASKSYFCIKAEGIVATIIGCALSLSIIVFAVYLVF